MPDILTHVHWMILATVLFAAEFVFPGGYLIWASVGAAIIGLVAWFIPAMNSTFQVFDFALLTVPTLIAWHGFRTRRPKARVMEVAHETPRETVLVTAIVDGLGKVRVGDALWPVTGPDTPAGVTVRIVGKQGSVLIVEPVQA